MANIIYWQRIYAGNNGWYKRVDRHRCIGALKYLVYLPDAVNTKAKATHGLAPMTWLVYPAEILQKEHCETETKGSPFCQGNIIHGANGPLYVTSCYSTWIFCRGVSGFATDCPCDVWCRGLTTCLLHVGTPFGNRILNNSWAVGLT